MKITKHEHLDFLDPLRGLAIAMVFLFHCFGGAFTRDHLSWGEWFPQFSLERGQATFSLLSWLSLGHLGVALFFVVSGFCIHLSLRRSSQGCTAFFARRFFRIVPPYALVLLVFALFLPGRQLDFSLSQDRWQFASHLFLFQNLDEQWLFGINPSFWSVAVEAQLYLAYPALLWLAERWGWSMTMAFTAGVELGLRAVSGWSLMAYGVEWQHWIMYSPLAYGFSWSLGAWLAEAYLKDRPLPLRRCPPFLLVTVSVVCLLLKPLSTFGFTAAAMMTAVVMSRMLDRERASSWALRATGWLRSHLAAAGVVSYSLYLIHQPLVLLLAQGLRSRFELHSLSIFMVCVLSWFPLYWLSGLTWRWLEMSSVEIGKRFIRRWSPSRAAEGGQTITA